MGHADIILVEDVLDIELQGELVGQADVGGPIHPCVTGHRHGIADRGEHLRLVIEAEAEPDPVADVITAPQRSRELGHARHLTAFRRR